MSEHDCSNCGAIGGEEYGTCTNCTPPVVIEAKKKLLDLSLRKIQESVSTLDLEVKAAQEEFNTLYERFKPYSD